MMLVAIEHLKQLGSVGKMWDVAKASKGVRWMMNNAHVHLPPNFSAFGSVPQAMKLARAERCGVVGASNYYDYGAYTAFALAAREENVFPLFGMEIICMIDDLR